MKSNQSSPEINWSGLFLPAGIGLGTGIGALLGNVGVGMIFGVVLGTALSLLFATRRDERS